ncbi:MAG: collagen-like triple helix repeat-containing protein, partial [Candidatus Nitrosotenuis sp.]
TALTTGTSKAYFRMPYAFTVTAVRASLFTAQSTGNIFTVDINESGTSIISTKLTIDNTEKTSTTAATAAVISDTALADDAEITIDIDQVGDGTAKGLVVEIIGRRA